VFEDLALPENMSVRFQPTYVGTVPADRVDLSKFESAVAGQSWLYVDSQRTRLELLGGPAIQYSAYVRTATDSSRLAEWVVRGEARGVFEDQVADVNFELRQEGAPAARGTIKMRIGSSPPPSDGLLLDRPMLEVPLSGGETPVVLTVRRSHVAFVLRQIGVEPVDQVWTTKPRWVTSAGDEVSSERKAVLQLETQPSLGRAIEHVLRSGSPQPTGRLIARLDYSTRLFEDRPRSQQIEIPFRFVPSLLHVAFALVVGSLLGAVLYLALAWPGLRGAARRVALGTLGALVLGFVGGLLVTHNSRFVILGFDLNPLELLPAAVLGIVSGLGTERALVAAGLLPREA
jgi:hypothetical protein